MCTYKHGWQRARVAHLRAVLLVAEPRGGPVKLRLRLRLHGQAGAAILTHAAGRATRAALVERGHLDATVNPLFLLPHL